MKTIVITGATGVLCREFALSLARDGHNIALIARSEEKLKSLCDEIQCIGSKAVYCKADVTNEEEMVAAHEYISEKLGKCDVLINGAGGNHPMANTKDEYCNPQALNEDGSFFDMKRDGFTKVFDLNLWGTVLPSRIFSKDMVSKSGCSIINISSMAAFSPLTKTPAYCAAKAGISNFTMWLAVHLAPANIRVNAIAPGFFLTEQNRHLLYKDDGSFSPRADKIISGTPMRRFGEPKELTGTLKFLIDEEKSGFITGCVVPVDGGFSAYSGV